MSKVDSFKKGRRMIEDYPDHSKNKLEEKKWLDWEQTINNQYTQNVQERPGALRENIVNKYVNSILGKDAAYMKNFNICKKMIQLRIDNRVLNQMR